MPPIQKPVTQKPTAGGKPAIQVPMLRVGKPVTPTIVKPATAPTKPVPIKVLPVAKASKEVVYPEIDVVKCLGDKALTVAKAKELLGWETEAMYAARTGEKISFGDDFMCKNIKGEKVRCWNNLSNRPFTEAHARELGQSVLTRDWADARNTREGEEEMTINGETISITKTAQIDSGQHRLTGLVFAGEEWVANKAHWIDKWPTEPTMEALLVFGVSDNKRVTQTLDNVRPRTLTDVLYTSPTFADLGTVEKRECSRMLAYATDLMWARVRAADAFIKYQSHAASLDFVDRHPKMVDCVAFIFKENKDRSLSNLRLSPGHSAAFLYLMGSCDSDNEEYSVGQPPSEKHLSWTYWDMSCQFWKLLSNIKDDRLLQVRKELQSLVDDETGQSGRAAEKHAIICKAWNVTVEHEGGEENITKEQVALEYGERDGRKVLVDQPNVGGIDMGPPKTLTEKPPTDVEIAEDKSAKQEARVKELDGKAKVNSTPTVKGTAELPLIKQLRELHQKYPGKTFLFVDADGARAWNEDAGTVAGVLKLKTIADKHQMRQCLVLPEIMDHAIESLMRAGHDVAMCSQAPNGDLMVEVQKPKPKLAAPKPAAKPPVKPVLRGGVK